MLTGETPDDNAGIAMAPGGDWDGDGFAELVVGAYDEASNGLAAGSAYVVSFAP